MKFNAEVKFKPADMMLPLLMSGGLGGSSGSDDMMMLALVMMNQNRS